MRWLLLVAWLVAPVATAGEVDRGTSHTSGAYTFTVAPVPEFVVARDVPAQWPDDAPGARDGRWRYWLHDVQADRRDGRHALYVRHAYEPRTASILGDAGRFTIEFSPAFQQLEIHAVRVRRDGQWSDRLEPSRISLARREADFERDLSDGVVTAMIVLEDIRVGDVVSVAYTVFGSNPILEGQVVDANTFAWRNPVLDTWLRVLLDPGAEPAIHREHGAPGPVVRESAEATEVTLHAHASPAIVHEGDYPAWYQPYPMARVAERRDWADVVDWAIPLYPPVATLPADLEARIAQWQALPEVADRVHAAVRAVQDEVRYFGIEMGDNTHRPVAPGVTWTRRYGDCKDKTYLLATILGRMGIEAVPALVSLSKGRAIADHPPGASAFDHVIVRVNLADGPLWVDGTLSQQGGRAGDSDLSRLGWALPVERGVDALVAIEAPDTHDNSVTTQERFVAIDDGAAVELTVRTVYTGNSADIARQNLGDERPSDLSRRYADYYRGRYGELEVIDLARLVDDRERNRVVLTETYRLAEAFEASAGYRALDVEGEALLAITNMPDTVERHGPLAFATVPVRYRHEVELVVPDAWRPAFDAARVTHGSSAFRYESEFAPTDEGARIAYTLDVLETDVTGARVGAHLDEMRDVRDDLSTRVSFHAPPEKIGERERRKRLEALIKEAMGDAR